MTWVEFTHPDPLTSYIGLIKHRTVMASACWSQGRNRHVFLRGTVIFPDFFSRREHGFFPVENSHFGRLKTNFRRFYNTFYNFSYFRFQFSTFHLQFSFFSSQFSPLFLFSLPLFSRYVNKNFPVRSLWGACPLPVTPLVGVAVKVHCSYSNRNYHSKQ